jgi:hypothetical protein
MPRNRGLALPIRTVTTPHRPPLRVPGPVFEEWGNAREGRDTRACAGCRRPANHQCSLREHGWSPLFRCGSDRSVLSGRSHEASQGCACCRRGMSLAIRPSDADVDVGSLNPEPHVAEATRSTEPSSLSRAHHRRDGPCRRGRDGVLRLPALAGDAQRGSSSRNRQREIPRGFSESTPVGGTRHPLHHPA